jgi:hypothetical protein
MTKKIMVLAVCVFVAGAGFAQSAGFAQGRVQFRSTEWVGLSSGEAGSAGQIQTVNGISKGPWFVGVGAGVDYYRYRSVPLFLSVTRDLAIGKRDLLFLYLDGGTNVPWYTRTSTPEDYFTSDGFHAGEYWSGGLGYLWKLGDHTSKAVLFSVGYTVKKLSEDQTTPSDCCCGIPCPMTLPGPVVYEYLNRMYQFMVGFRF